jgi:hypothetical protein
MNVPVAKCVIVLGLALAGSSQASAQERGPSATSRLIVGSRVRVTTPSLSPQRRVSFYGGQRNDSLFLLALPRLDSTGLAIADIRQLERSDGVQTRSKRASLIWALSGLAGGTLLGIGLGSVLFEDAKGCGTYDFTGCNEGTMGQGILGLAGGLAGVTIAFNYSRKPRETWHRVSLR